MKSSPPPIPADKSALHSLQGYRNLLIADYILATLGLVLLFARNPIEYWDGTQNGTSTLGVCLFLFTAFYILILFLKGVACLFAPGIRLRGILMFFVFLVLVLLANQFVPNTKIFLYGYKSYVLSRLGEVELERLGMEIETTLPIDSSIDVDIYSIRSGQTPKMNFFPLLLKLKNLNYIRHDNNRVMIISGGALPGHWGTVYSSSQIKKDEYDWLYLPFNKHIAFVYETG